MPHPDIWKPSHLFTHFSIFAVIACCLYRILNLVKADIPYMQYLRMQHCSIPAFLDNSLPELFSLGKPTLEYGVIGVGKK